MSFIAHPKNANGKPGKSLHSANTTAMTDVDGMEADDSIPVILTQQETIAQMMQDEKNLLGLTSEQMIGLQHLLQQIIDLLANAGLKNSGHSAVSKLSGVYALVNFRKRLVNRIRFSQLTPRETEVLTKLAEGNTNKQVASQLFISPDTVKHHHKIIKSKLQASSTADLIKYAQAFDLV